MHPIAPPMTLSYQYAVNCLLHGVNKKGASRFEQDAPKTASFLISRRDSPISLTSHPDSLPAMQNPSGRV